MLFTKRDIRDWGGRSLSQRFSSHFARYLQRQHVNHSLENTPLIDIATCYSILGEATAHPQDDIQTTQQIINQVITRYEKQTGRWLESEQVALAAINHDVCHQAVILSHHFPTHLTHPSFLHSLSNNSFLRLALLAEALGIQRFSLSDPIPSLANLTACQCVLNVLLDDVTMADIEASGRTLKESCQNKLIQLGANPDALQDSWLLRMRYTNSDTSLSLKCMPIEMLRETFETQHKQQFGLTDNNPLILIEALEIEVTLQVPCRPGEPANNHYVQQIMSQWKAASIDPASAWDRVDDKATQFADLSFLSCPILKKLLADFIAKPSDLAMTDFFIKNLQKGVDEVISHN